MEQSTAPRFFCFVLMPFDKAFNDTYKLAIKEGAIDAGAYCERVDEPIYEERMLDRIYNQIAKADLIIADVTGQNPNVMYEVGYAHALNKPTILITKNVSDIPFDFKHFFHVVYDELSELKKSITDRVRYYHQKGIKSLYQTEYPLEVFCAGKSLLKEEDVIGYYHAASEPIVDVVVKNNSLSLFKGDEWQIGFVTKGYHLEDNDFNEYSIIELPDDTYFHLFNLDSSLLPGSYFRFTHELDNITPHMNPIYKMKIRIITTMGVRDFPLTIMPKPIGEFNDTEPDESKW